jgi:hypothetical protein
MCMTLRFLLMCVGAHERTPRIKWWLGGAGSAVQPDRSEYGQTRLRAASVSYPGFGGPVRLRRGVKHDPCRCTSPPASGNSPVNKGAEVPGYRGPAAASIELAGAWEPPLVLAQRPPTTSALLRARDDKPV